jgi:hypothetical protein
MLKCWRSNVAVLQRDMVRAAWLPAGITAAALIEAPTLHQELGQPSNGLCDPSRLIRSQVIMAE